MNSSAEAVGFKLAELASRGVLAYVGGDAAIELPMPEPASSRLVLIDGSGYILRAFFALPPLTDP